jgi:hypothetical protein
MRNFLLVPKDNKNNFANAKLKLQPDSIARQPHASVTKKTTPDHQWHMLENFENTNYSI